MNLVYIILLLFVVKSHANDADNYRVETTPKSPFDLYLDDVVHGLKNQNWTDEELPCLNAILHWISNLHNFTTWAVWEWDALSLQPVGLLSGNLHNFGNFDQCMTSPWKTHHPEIKSQYCLADVIFETNVNKAKRLDEIKPYGNAMDMILHKTPHFRPLNKFTWGVCVPACCQRKSVERFVKVLLDRSHLATAGLRPRISVNETCQRPDEPKMADAAFYAYMVVVGMLFVVTIAFTILNNRHSGGGGVSKNAIYRAFCLKTNSEDLLKITRDGLEPICAIRFLTIALIVTLHISPMTTAGPIINGIETDELHLGISWFAMHSDLLVDTFFVISGLLLAKKLLEYNHLPSVPLMILNRYVRLVVALAVVTLFMATVYPYIGSGPLWYRFSETESRNCRDNWYLNLLMLSSYIRIDRKCLPVTWYVPCDFHFYCVTVTLYAVYKRWPRVGVISATFIAAASIIIPGVISYIKDYHPIIVFDYEFYINFNGNELFTDIYSKSHNRAGAYFVGIYAGFMYDKYRNRGNVKLTKKKSAIYACVAGLVIALVVVTGISYSKRSYFPLEGHLYAALNRPIYAAALALLIHTLTFGELPLVSGFLKWNTWVPLSHLSYGVYLIHFIIILRGLGISRTLAYYDGLNIIVAAVGLTAICFFLSYVMWLFIEAPINNLFLLLLSRRRPKKASENGRTDLIDSAILPCKSKTL